MSDPTPLPEGAAAFLVAAAQHRLATLYDQGHQVYQGSNLGCSVLLFRRVKELAESVHNRGMTSRARFWEGAALHGAGKLHEAMATLAPAAASGPQEVGDEWEYMAVTRYVLIAVELPVPLAVIQKALDEACRRYGGSGTGGRRSRLLLIQARLALARGQAREAVMAAQEAEVRRTREAIGFSPSTHMRTLVKACIHLGDLELARHHLEAWERLQPAYPVAKRVSLAATRSMVLRREGRADEALDWARRSWHEGRQTDDLPVRFTSLKCLIRAYLATTSFEAARDPLVDLLRLRNSAIGQVRYETGLMLADYHLTRARRAAGLPAVDLEYQGEAMASAGAVMSGGGLGELQRARRLYHRLLETAQTLDSLLCCDIRTREIEGRLRLTNELCGGAKVDEERG